MKHISFDQRFVNEAGNDLIAGKIHTIRQNYEYWEKFEGKEVALCVWEGKPRQKGSKQKVFCVKRIVSVQMIYLRRIADRWLGRENGVLSFAIDDKWRQLNSQLAENDGFPSTEEFNKWFKSYEPGKLAILHFTDFRY